MSKDLPPVTPEHALLETVFLSLKQFAFDKAREIIDREKEASQKVQAGSYWVQVLSALQHLITVEKSYATFVIPQARGFLKNLTPKLSYEGVRADLVRLEMLGGKYQQLGGGGGGSPGNPAGRAAAPGSTGSMDKLLAHLCGQLADYVRARSDMMAVYEKLAVAGSTNRNINYTELVADITDITNRHQKNFHHPILSFLKSGFAYECDILKHLLQAQADIQCHQFVASLLHLNDAKAKLKSWSPVASSKTETWSVLGSWSAAAQKRPLAPNLYQWLVSVKDATVSKFTLYFHEVLSKQTNTNEMKSLAAKTSLDYVQKFVSFQKKHNVDFIGIVLDTTELPVPYKGPGYHHPERRVDKLMGLASYPVIFSLSPPGSSSVGAEHALQPHWPSVIMLIMDRKSGGGELSGYDRVSYFYDSQHECSYYFTKLDTYSILLVICRDKRSDKDSHINAMMLETSEQLRMCKLYAALKSYTK